MSERKHQMTLYASWPETLESPAISVAAVTPDDDADLPRGACKALWIAADGNLEFIAAADSASITVAVTAGSIVPIRVRRVREGTTATVVALY